MATNLTLNYDVSSGRFNLISGYENRHLPKEAGFRWDPQCKTWWTNDTTKARVFERYASPGARERLDAHKQTVAASRAASSDAVLPVPAGLDYLPYQRAGISVALSRANSLFGDEMGLGKTVQALGTVNADPTAKNVLVICPASLKINWSREASRWLVRKTIIQVVNGKGIKPLSTDTDNLLIVNYDIVKKHSETLKSTKWDVVIADEAHYIKNPKALRTKAVKDVVAGARRRLLLTGTPILNRPVELVPMLEVLQSNLVLPKAWGFLKRYCNAFQTKWGWDFSGASNLPELQERLRGEVLIRRLKKDVLKELPPKRRQVVELSADDYRDVLRDEEEVLRENDRRIEDAQHAIDVALVSEDEEAYQAAVRALQAANTVAFTEISRVRHDTAVRKVPSVLEHTIAVLEETDKVLLFAHHHDVVDSLVAGLQEYGAVSLTGRESQEQRQQAVDRFQNDPSCRVFIGSIGAAGVGLTLTAAQTVLFAELAWRPSDISQAEDRAHRIGQTGSVLVQHLVLDGSLDARMAQTIVNKQNIADRALDTRHKDKDLDVHEITQRPRTQVGREFTDEEREVLLAGIRRIASRCDGAVAEDAMGFNGRDTNIGRSLAQFRRLSDKQAAVALKLLTIYHRQLPADVNERVKAIASKGREE